MLNIHFPVNMKPTSMYWLSSLQCSANAQSYFDNMVADMNKLAYAKIIDSIYKIGNHFKLDKNEIKKLIKNVHSEFVGDYIVDNENGQWNIFNEFYRLAIDEPIKRFSLVQDSNYFKSFNVKCLLKFDENYKLMDVIFHLSKPSKNKLNIIEIVFDSEFNLNALYLEKIKYNKHSTKVKELIKDNNLMSLTHELAESMVFFK